jgi:hypothetical protein
MIHVLSMKLEQIQLNYDDVNKEKDTLREVINERKF